MTTKKKVLRKQASQAVDPSRMGDLVELDLDSVKPYWRNPRHVTEEAVNALVSSITAYGYHQPIVVDEHHVIIVGHTRYAALRKMGWQRAQVLVTEHLSPTEAKQLRVIDNRVGEVSGWDHDSLAEELAELDSSLLRSYFPEIETGGSEAHLPMELPNPDLDMYEVAEVDFVCPSCYRAFTAEVSRANVLSGVIGPAEHSAEAQS